MQVLLGDIFEVTLQFAQQLFARTGIAVAGFGNQNADRFKINIVFVVVGVDGRSDFG